MRILPPAPGARANFLRTRQAPGAPGETRERGSPPDRRGTRSATFTPSTYNAQTRTVEVVLSTGARVRRWFGFEELAIGAAAIDLTRVGQGQCPLLNAHNQSSMDDVLGRVISARVEGTQLIGVVQFADTEQGRKAEGMVARGELIGISIGYLVRTWTLTEVLDDEDEVWSATSWELVEASLVPVPADPNAGVRSLGNDNPGETAATGTPSTAQDDDMLTRSLGGAPANSTPAANTTAAPETGDTGTRAESTAQTPAAPAASTPAAGDAGQRQAPATLTAAQVRELAANAGLDAGVQLDIVARHADAPMSREAALAEIGRRFAERDDGNQVRTQNRISVTRDAGDTMRRGMADAILHRLSPGTALPDHAREYRGMSLLRMAEDFLTANGVSVRGMSRSEIADASFEVRSMHTTGDFPQLVGGALNRRLRQAYEAAVPTYRIWARRAPNAPDFRSIDVVQMSAMPDLAPVNEKGEFKYGTAFDGKTTYKLASYGVIIGFSRQMLINDDLRALDRVTSGFAGSAARLENRIVYGLVGNGATKTMMPDGKPLFAADHANLAPAGGPISQATLTAGRSAMRLQKGLQGELLNLAPRFLVVPTALEQMAYQFTSSQFVPAKSADTNEFRAGGRTALEPVVEAELDGISPDAWHLIADNSQVDTIEYAYLDGSEGVQMSNRVGFTSDGVEFKAQLDFAAAAIDHRGMYRNPGK